MAARTIVLELLRHGPAHNQLLSPLTPYLGLAGSRDAETVHVGFDHAAFLRRIQDLRYRDGNAPASQPTRRAALDEISAEVTRIFAAIRALATEISAGTVGDARAVHLRLVLSAAELSLLPFELARSPAGFPGEGQWLSLQTSPPIVITREARRVPQSALRWPEKPRVLVVAASPGGLPEVPLRAHLLALREALAPWLLSAGTDELHKHITVLSNARLSEVRDACDKAADRPYTHVHILAHGVQDPNESPELGPRYGVALCREDDREARAVVSGELLAAALTCHPAVVTLASCDSGNVGSVISPGASIAHDLHEARVPMVIASQFPLSMRGSAIMAEEVYRRLLVGEDPRTLLHALRRRLYVDCTDTHDWASIVAYAALPHDIDAQVQRAKLAHPIAVLSGALSRRDLRTDRQTGTFTRTEEDIEVAMDRLAAAVIEGGSSPDLARAYGVLGNAGKRLAHAFCARPLWPIEPAPAPLPAPDLGAVSAFIAPAATAPGDQARARRTLERARRAYMEVFRCGVNEAWPLVQYLALGNALWPADRDLPDAERVEAQREYTHWWTFAQLIAEDNLRAQKGHVIAWARSALTELHVLAQVLPEGHPERENAVKKAWEHLNGVIQGGTDFDKYSLRRQLRRYANWWWSGPAHAELRKLPAALDARLEELGVVKNLFMP